MRGTGRTARTLQRALDLAAHGNAVLIVAHSANYARQLERRIAPNSNVRFCSVHDRNAFIGRAGYALIDNGVYENRDSYDAFYCLIKDHLLDRMNLEYAE
jgi:hypothetical protein